MLALRATAPGGPEVLELAEVADPRPAAGEVLIRVAAAGVNRADLLQRQGFYPPPPGAPETLGLECSGTIEAVGHGVEHWSRGDAVCALLAGGGCAELVCVPAAQVVALPRGVELVSGAAIPEAFATAHDALFTRGSLRAGETVLIHGGSGGVGTAAIQLAAAEGARVLVTAGSVERVARCRALGAEDGADHHRDDFVAMCRDATGGRGADVIVDVIGAAYLERNLRALAPDGRLVVIGLQGGVRAELDLGAVLRTRAGIVGTTLRARPVAQKREILELLVRDAWDGFAARRLRPVVDRVLPLSEAAEAHRLLERGGVFGKVLLAP